MKIKHVAAVLALASILSTNANAFSCTGRVGALQLEPSGDVWMSLVRPADGVPIWEYNFLCSLRTSAAANGVAPEVCQKIYDMLSAAATQRRKVTFWVDKGNSQADCTPNRFPSWTVLRTGEGGWYSGPALELN